jgi:hypothetical protein
LFVVPSQKKKKNIIAIASIIPTMKIENKAVEGILTYPRPAPLGCQSGRVIDEEHWRKGVVLSSNGDGIYDGDRNDGRTRSHASDAG